MTTGDLVDLLARDHREIERLLTTAMRQRREVPGLADRSLFLVDRDRPLALLIAELAGHIAVEEEHLYPLVRRMLPDGPARTDEALGIGRRAEQLMRRLEHLDRDDLERDSVMAELAGVTRSHIRVAEAELFPALRATTPPGDLDRLAEAAERTRRRTPTRAHPGAPHTPPWNQLLNPGIGAVDRLRDAIAGRPPTRR